MKKILFIPTYTYLSSPIFSNLLVELKEYETIYLDIEDQYNSNKTSREFKNQFNKSTTLYMHAKNKTFMDNIIKFFKMLEYHDRLKKYISVELPSAIVTTSDLTFSIRIIKKYFPKIPIFIIQPALFSNKMTSSTFFHKVALLFTQVMRVPFVSSQNYFGQEFDDSFVFLWGEYFLKRLKKKNNLHIIGDITLDHLPIKKNKKIKNQLLKKKGFSEETKIITICTTAFNGLVSKDIEEKLYRLYRELIRIKRDVLFIIKPHPRDNGEEIKKIFHALDVNNVIILNRHLHDLFQYTDIHISSFSRTATEALATSIPFLSVNPDNEIMLEDFFVNELNEKVANIDEMIYKVNTLLEEPSDFFLLREIYVAKMFYKLDGNAGVRACKIIKKELFNHG